MTRTAGQLATVFTRDEATVLRRGNDVIVRYGTVEVLARNRRIDRPITAHIGLRAHPLASN